MLKHQAQSRFTDLKRPIMSRFDLIIDALEKAKDGWQCFDEYEKALTAARELKALKPAAFIENHKAGQNLSWSQDDLPYAKATKLYALDEVTK
jgi:hypothetical protein